MHSVHTNLHESFFFDITGFDETAVGLTKALIDQLNEDDLFETVRDNIVGFISDGASVIKNYFLSVLCPD